MNRPELQRHWIPLGILGLAISGFGCATSGGGDADLSEQPLGASVDALAEELARVARQRTDLSSMRVCLHPVTEIQVDNLPPLSARYRTTDLDYLAEEITEELELALSSRFHLIDTDLFGQPPQPWALEGRESGSQVAEHFGATHLAVGTLVPHVDRLQLKIRLVDTGNWVIVATARGTVPLEFLSDRSRVALGDLVPYRGPVFPRDESPREDHPTRIFDEPSLAAYPEEVAESDLEVAAASEEQFRPRPRELQPIDSSRQSSSYASWKLLKKKPSDRTDLDLLLHSRESYGQPVEGTDLQEPTSKAGPAAVRFAALGRSLK